MLKPCPFCGGRPKLECTHVYAQNARRVRCEKCKVGTLPVIEGLYQLYGGKQNVAFTIEEAESEVTRIWNARTP